MRRVSSLRKAAPLAAALIVALSAGACAPRPAAPAPAAKAKVLAAESFLADIARNVAGDRLEVSSLIPVGVDPHGFEPAPADVARVADSAVLIINGAGFEGFLNEILENAGGERRVIEASAGLASRSAREGELAVMSDDELAEVMCAAAGEPKTGSVSAGPDAAGAVAVPGESGLFAVDLTRQTDGAYGGALRYTTDEAGDFQIATGAGQVVVSNAADASPVEAEKTLALSCAGLAQGAIMELEKGGAYVVTLSGFQAAQAMLLIGPAGGAHQHEGDPHFWLDPLNVIVYVENIRDGLIQADPAGEAAYRANAEAYIAKLRELDGWIAGQVKDIPEAGRRLVTNHESFGYFADRYGFRVVGTIVPNISPTTAPSAQQMARLIDRVKETGARAIFLETGSNPKLAEQLARETGIRVVTELYSHSLSDANGPASTYLDMMRYNTQAIVTALRQAQ